ncbi:potassium transporter [Agrilactobacillus composti DSM 18527 = JCM 14202]|uniref:Probable potassium transport system protein Kup n=1 Tax=Agrilactobacillus composti DSM 18527 = JCM 14202 TaxID=1423734 RepID=X0PGF5_9LACO|nr:KUP/HAK/KT family potassium transporter [Agrilactobacillus composti]KRM33890.1 potassium transporter [Agrilactobacillus composti DSM 18527 = JCM 14202]GAF40968.1 Kup system potassium uptake protein [Agrilactobacillus composti DSM 18527 = JCM 14202]
MDKKMDRVTGAGMLVTLGIVYGDIGTSPLYVMNAIIGDAGKMGNVSPKYIIGAVSLIFWTLLIITTLKYVIIAMQADNNKEGGIFALYALVRHHGKWLIFPALIGGAAILADGTLTPAVTVTSAIEGLKNQQIGALTFSNSQHDVLLITTVVLLLLFVIQRFGTGTIGKSFGPVMVVWFGFLAVFGILNLLGYPAILKALSPYYAVEILFSPVNKVGIFILGSVFLATTGAEALYSDMGHVGKKNIHATWPFVFLALFLNYLGQGAWIINHANDAAYRNLSNLNPFYEMLPGQWRLVGIIVATFAAIIASQALITGSYTLVDEAMGLKFLPRMIIKHPSNVKNQIYIATVNWLLCAVTLGVVWYFGSSQKMEAAYGLAITITMVMTTLLLFQFLKQKLNYPCALVLALFFGTIETVFLIASLVKFIHGGYITLLIMLAILYVMWVWYFGNKRRDHYERESEYVSLLDYRDQLAELSADDSVPMYTTNLVYMTRIKKDYRIKRSTVYSILDQEPKRAKVYWFVTVNETNAPYESTYTVDMLDTKNIVDVQLFLGFRKAPTVTAYLHQVVDHLVEQGVLDPQVPKYSTQKHRKVGGFKFVLINEQPADLSINDQIPPLDRRLIAGRIYLQNITASPVSWYGLGFSNVVQESSPLFIVQQKDQYLVQRKIYHKRR